MYSPKISENLIPLIYERAKSEKKPMTKVVNEILLEKLIEQVRETDNTKYAKTSNQKNHSSNFN